MNYTIRTGTKNDLKAIQGLVRQLAEYEKAPNEVTTTEQDLLKFGFGTEKIFDFFVAEIEGKVVGFALYFWKYSTWKGKALYLEDFYVEPEYRKYGMGSQLFAEVVKVAHMQNAQRMEWQVLEWNKLALDFYRRYDAKLDEQWINGQLFPKDFARICNTHE